MKKAAIFILLVLCLSSGAGAFDEYLVPALGGTRLMYDSNPDYINDHAVIQAGDGAWHMIGITHKKMLGGKFVMANWEDKFAHAAAPALAGPWTRQPPVLPVDPRLLETHVWAPYILFNNGLYYCFYAAGGGHFTSMINLATSPDLENWTRHPKALFRDFYDARDPMVLEDGGRWTMYYTKTYSIADWRSTVAYRTSNDLINWSGPGFAMVLTKRPGRLINSGQTESPFVAKVGDLYYLFFCSPDLAYRATFVYVSDDPLHFSEDDEIALLPYHCAEIIKHGDDWYVSHAGWFYDGVYLAKLDWQPARRFSPAFRLADAGEDDQYLVSAPGAKKAHDGLYLGLRPGPGAGLDYNFPVPAGVSRIDLTFQTEGAARVIVSGRTVIDDAAAPAETAPRTVALDDPDLWSAGSLAVRFEAARSRMVLSYARVYYR